MMRTLLDCEYSHGLLVMKWSLVRKVKIITRESSIVFLTFRHS